MIDDDPFLTDLIEGAQTTLALGDTVVSAEIQRRMATTRGLSVEAGRPWVARSVVPPHHSAAMRHKDLVWPS